MNSDQSIAQPDRGKGFWQPHVEAWKTSGGTQHDYCVQHHLSPKLFSLWKNKLIKDKTTAKASKPQFVPVVTSPEPSQTTLNTHIDIKLPNGISLQIPSTATTQAAELVKQLVSVSC